MQRPYSHRYPGFDAAVAPPYPPLPTRGSSSKNQQNIRPAQHMHHPPLPTPPSAGMPPSIKCSTCSAWIDVDYLEDHICSARNRASHGGGREASSTLRGTDEHRRKRPDIRIDIVNATTRDKPSKLSPSQQIVSDTKASISYRSPMSYLPNYGGSRTPSPLPYPVEPATASSGSKLLPFFDRYQQLVRSTTDKIYGTATRSPTLLIPPTLPEPTPISVTAAAKVAEPASTNNVRRRRSNSELAYAAYESAVSSSPRSSFSTTTTFSAYAAETPATSIDSDSPRSREASSSLRDVLSIKTSRSTPNGLSSYAAKGASSYTAPPIAALPRSRNKTSPEITFGGGDGGRSADRERERERERRPSRNDGGLDACMADLQLLADDDRYDRAASKKQSGRTRDDREPPMKTNRREERGRDEGGLAGGLAALTDFMYGDRERDDGAAARSTARRELSSSRNERRSPVEPTFKKNSNVDNNNPSSSSQPRRCTTCRRTFIHHADTQRAGDGQLFCRPCYGDRFLPKCRKCELPIEGGSVTSSDGKVVGKYHQSCFVCFVCSEPFPDKDFYVYDGKPLCKFHYHESNGSLCKNKSCKKPIEGPCVSLVGEEQGGGGRYHPQCFCCAERHCRTPLLEHHFVVAGLPYCERHADQYDIPSFLSQPPPPSSRHRRDQDGHSSGKTSNARKRQTIITRT